MPEVGLCGTIILTVIAICSSGDIFIRLMDAICYNKITFVENIDRQAPDLVKYKAICRNKWYSNLLPQKCNKKQGNNLGLLKNYLR